MKAILISQNVVLRSIGRLNKVIKTDEPIIFISTQMLFKNEKAIVKNYLCVNRFLTFSELLTDEDMEKCDKEAFNKVKIKKDALNNLNEYYEQIKIIKNCMIIKQLRESFGVSEGFICSDDLGIDRDSWLNNGFSYYKLQYYYNPNNNSSNDYLVGLKCILKRFKPLYYLYNEIFYMICRKQKYEVYVSKWNGLKYVFIGSLNKVGYRIILDWTESEEDYKKIKKGKFEKADKVCYLSTLHEWTKSEIPDNLKYNVYYIQDGYLPPNYSSLNYYFFGKYVKYYTWDSLGLKIFKNQGLPAYIMPFRKKLYLPEANLGGTIKKILIVTSGAGDWTAVKNRSDEDLMVEAFGEIAKIFPEIEFVYRCHPVWVHPMHQGVNSIKRVVEYFEYLNLPNIKVSSNIIEEKLKDFKLSLPRQSMDADLEGTDLVVGEHSIAMVDGAFKGIPFASLNLTGRRNFFSGISDLGFPHFESVDELVEFIKRFPSDEGLKNQYRNAIQNYNNMTDEE